MNIKITYDWLLEYLDTDADPYELQKYLSLCGPSIESVEKKGEDYVLDIEVTSNRVDMASVFGIAQEAVAILPQFGKKAKLKTDILGQYKVSSIKYNGENKLPLEIKLTNNKFASRITAIVLSNIVFKDSDPIVKKRLELCGQNTINNVVDISNYIRMSLGQPCHIFDYDQIAEHRMIVRESKKGELVITLDKERVTLPGNDIVIEDGSGKLIDQPGIMGAYNSSVQKSTKNIVLFVPIFDGKMVRRTSMLTGKRSDAATYFEKGLDEERVGSAMSYGVELLEQFAGAKIASDLVDIYPAPYKTRSIKVKHDFVTKRIGVDLKPDQCKKILSDLGFKVERGVSSIEYRVSIPSWRSKDIEIPEDIVEEISRIYGYHNLPNNMPPMVYVQPQEGTDKLFSIQNRIKYFLKHLGLHESMNYSMISEAQIKNLNLETAHHLKISNTISEELQYMRTSIIPSLIKNIKDNQGKQDVLKFFEIAKVYYPSEKDLPKEIYKLTMATNKSFFDLKGIVEALLTELKITDYELRKAKIHIFSKNEVIDYVLKGGVIGSVGKLSEHLQHVNGLKSSTYIASFDLLSLMEHSRIIAPYKPINPYATIKLDLNIKTGKKTYGELRKLSFGTSSLLEKVELSDVYKDTITLRFYFSSTKKNLTELEAQKELEKIKALV